MSGGSFVCIGEQTSYVTSDGSQAIVTVERAELVDGIEHVVKITTSAGADLTFAWQVGDTSSPAGPFYGRTSVGARSPGFPSVADANGVAEGWLAFLCAGRPQAVPENAGGDECPAVLRGVR